MKSELLLIGSFFLAILAIIVGLHESIAAARPYIAAFFVLFWMSAACARSKK